MYTSILLRKITFVLCTLNYAYITSNFPFHGKHENTISLKDTETL